MAHKSALVITGVNGFIGRRLCAAVKRGPYRIYLVDKSLRGLDRDSGFTSLISCDITKPDQLQRLEIIKGPVRIIHLAASVPHIPSHEEAQLDSMVSVNIKGTMNLLGYFASRIRRFCYVSTLEVYGRPRNLPIKETHLTEPASFYGMTKLAGEHALRIFCFRRGVEAVILRLSSVYGPGEDYDRAIPNLVRAAIGSKPLRVYGHGRDIRDYVYIDDAIEGILSAINKPGVCGIYNIACGKPICIKDLAVLIRRLACSNSKIQFCKPKKEYYNIYFNISKARKELRFRPRVSLPEGLAKEIEWFRQKT